MNRNFCSACGLWVLVTQRLCPACGHRSFSQNPPTKLSSNEQVHKEPACTGVSMPSEGFSARVHARTINVAKALLKIVKK